MGYQWGGRRGGDLFLKDGSSTRSAFSKRGKNDRSYVIGLLPTVNVSKNIKYFILRLIVIYENRILVRWENDQLPGSKNPGCSVFHASHGPDKLIGSMTPGYGGGLVGRLYPADPRKEGEKCLVSWLEWIFQMTSSQLEAKNLAVGRKFPLTAWTSSS